MDLKSTYGCLSTLSPAVVRNFYTHKVTVFYNSITEQKRKIPFFIYLKHNSGSRNNVSGVYYIIVVHPFDVKCIKATQNWFCFMALL